MNATLIEKLSNHPGLQKVLKIAVGDGDPLEVYVLNVTYGAGQLEFTVKAVYKSKVIPEKMCVNHPKFSVHPPSKVACKECLEALTQRIHINMKRRS